MHTKKSYFTAFQSVISVVILCFSLSLNAQIDSLQGKSYSELTKLYETTLFKNATEAKTYALAANTIAIKENDKEKIGWSLYNIAFANYFLVEYTESFYNLERSTLIANELKDNLLLFKNFNLKGNNLSEIGKDFEALDQYVTAQKYAELTEDPINTIVVSINIALTKKLHKNHQDALLILKENLNRLKKIDNSNPKKEQNERIVLMHLADTYLRINNPKEAAYYNLLAFEKCSKVKTPAAYYWVLLNDAIINYQNGNYKKTIMISKETISHFTEIDNMAQLVTPYFYLGKSYYQQQKYNDAILYIEKAIQVGEENKIAFHDQQEAHRLLHLSYTKIGNIIKATENFNAYSDLDKKYDSINMNLNNKIHKKYDIVPLQEEIESLGSDNQKQQKRAKYLYVISALLLVLLIGLFIWFKRKQHQNKTRFQQLLLKIKKLEEPKEKVAPEIIIKETSNPVTDENALHILKALAIFEEKELYLRQDCTLAYVAKKAKTNTTYLSNVINTYKEKPFKSYLSELRINAALIKLKNDEKLRSYTIKAIAEEFGFKRSETFSRAFKAQTDVYPSYYIKSLQNQKDI